MYIVLLYIYTYRNILYVHYTSIILYMLSYIFACDRSQFTYIIIHRLNNNIICLYFVLDIIYLIFKHVFSHFKL